jgi:hypothetical protein
MAKTSNNTRKLSHKLAKAETEVCKTIHIVENVVGNAHVDGVRLLLVASFHLQLFVFCA